MPIYEYECKDCGKRFDILQKISDRPLQNCRQAFELRGLSPSSECNGKGGSLKKLISATAFQLKGSGWYKDGYASASGTSSASSSTQGGNKETNKEVKGSESKTSNTKGE